jgi:RNA polymerase sigma-70 factor (ECF subfamily)
MPEELPDAELVQRIAARDESARDAEAALCRRFAPRVRLYGLRHLGGEDGARELVQMVLLGVLEAARAGRIEDPAKTERFVLGVCRNTVLRVRQVERRTSPTESEKLTELLGGFVPKHRADAGQLLPCIDALEERARTVIMLTFAEERETDEIARALSMTTGNVRVARHRAIDALRRCIDEKTGDMP